MKNFTLGAQNCKYIVKDYCALNKKRLNCCLLLIIAFVALGILFGALLFDSEKFVSVFIVINDGNKSVFGEFFSFLLLPMLTVTILFFSLRRRGLFFVGISFHFLNIALLFFQITRNIMFMEISCILFSIFVLLPYSLIFFCSSTVIVVNTYNFIRSKRCFYVTFTNSYFIFIIINLVNAILWFLVVFGILNLIF